MAGIIAGMVVSAAAFFAGWHTGYIHGWDDCVDNTIDKYDVIPLERADHAAPSNDDN